MGEISQEKFDEAKKAEEMRPKPKDELEELSEEKLQSMLSEMENPVKFQKELAIKIKISLDRQIKNDMKTKGYLSDHTRRWVESYNKILDRIQSAIHGDKSVNLHLHKVSNSDISNKIRESVFDITPEEEEKIKN